MAMPERRQVGIAPDQFCWQSTAQYLLPMAPVVVATSMRIRHFVECPGCRTRYLLSFSPYRNGSRLVSAVPGAWDDYILYCSCSRGSLGNRIRSSEVKRCDVSREAYRRGYGTAKEIVLLSPRHQDALDLSPYLDQPKSTDKRRNMP